MIGILIGSVIGWLFGWYILGPLSYWLINKLKKDNEDDWL